MNITYCQMLARAQALLPRFSRAAAPAARRRDGGWKRRWIQLVAVAASSVPIAAPSSAQVTGHITVDNAYGFGWGDANGITQYQNGVVNGTAGEIYNCPTGPETYSISGQPSSSGYFYLVTWSDDSVYQGALAEFSYPSNTIYTGVGAWEVFATGRDYDQTSGPPVNGAAGSDAINAQIAIANANAGNPATTSVGWVTAAGGLTYGPTSAGGSPFPSMPCMNSLARWMWFNASPGTITNPFNTSPPGGGGHKEYLIFRLRTDPTGCIPSITQQPSSQTVCVGGSLILSVTASSSTTASYQWFKNGVAFGGPTGSNTLNLSPAQASSAGSYSVVVSNACGSVTSSTVNVTVNAAPTITSHPSSWLNCNGVWVTLNVGASGAAPLAYQWFKDGSTLTGATASSLVLAAPGPVHSGEYWCVVSNACGSTSSNHATVVVVGGPTITTQPSNQSVCAGGTVQFQVAATSPHPSFPVSSYRWFKIGAGFLSDGGPYSGVTTPTLTISGASASEAGTYFVRVGNGCNFVDSLSRTLSLAPNTSITSWPPDSTLCKGSSVTLSMTATGASPLSLQWKNPQGVVVSTTSTVQLSPVVASHAGQWRCIATGACGPAVEKTFLVDVESVEPPQTATVSPGTVCTGGRITLQSTGGEGDVLRWYKDACGTGVLVGEGSPLEIDAPATATTYYARWESAPCGNSSCASVLVTPDPCPPSGPPWVTKVYSLIGPATGAQWSWSIVSPTFCDVGGTCVDGLPPPATACDIAALFAQRINESGCSASALLATPGCQHRPDCQPPGFHSPDDKGLLTVKVGSIAGSPTDFTLGVGPDCGPIDCYPTLSSPCHINPLIQEVPLSGQDCNGSGEDDVVDIATGTSADLNGDWIPDECQAPQPFCFGDGSGTPCPCGITATGEKPAALTIFLQGTTSSAPTFYGDGLRCVTGLLKRLYTHNASSGPCPRPWAGTFPSPRGRHNSTIRSRQARRATT